MSQIHHTVLPTSVPADGPFTVAYTETVDDQEFRKQQGTPRSLDQQLLDVSELVHHTKPYRTKVLDTTPTIVPPTETPLVKVTAHWDIVDVTTNTAILHIDNAVHVQNLARILARGLAHEYNGQISRIAFGDGGSVRGTTGEVIKPNNAGTSTWDSRIHHEIFSKIVDGGLDVLNPDLGKDLGSADTNTLARIGGTSFPGSDPTTILHLSGPGVRSVELDGAAGISITAYINADEPTTGVPLTINEIGLYSAGTQAIATNGYQRIFVNNRRATDNTSLNKGTQYSFNISVDGGAPQTITFTIPGTGSITFGELCEYVNSRNNGNGLIAGAKMIITSAVTTYPSIIGEDTGGFLVVVSKSTGARSSIVLSNGTWIPNNTPTFISQVLFGSSLTSAVTGQPAGMANAVANATNERERLLSHVTFAPITKPVGANWKFVYTLRLTISQ
jgi:hypothetical protein